jgi:hypothetical protein
MSKTTVVYDRNHKTSEPCVDYSNTALSEIGPHRGLYLDHFLKAAGESGWELTTTPLPFPSGKELSTGTDDEDDTPTFSVKDP